VVQYASAMKAVDPSIKVGAVLTLPGNWPDSVVAAGDSADWNKTVLSDAGGAIDFVIVHWYPSAPTVYSYGDEASGITTAAQGSAASQVLPPYCIETVVLRPQAGTQSALSAPGSPLASGVTATQATISWTPASGGTVDKYEVYRRNGTDSELLGTSTSDWNGTWSENGQAVTVTNLSWDGTLAADGGNTVDIGFAGANDGAYPSPAAFTLNGTVCATTYSS
jgi:hypothetical protein